MHKDPAFDDLDDFVDMDDTLDYMESEDAQDEGRTSFVVLKEKESANERVSTEAPVSTVKQNKGTDKKNEGTDKQDGSTDSIKVSTDRQGKGTADQNEGKSATQTAPTTTSTPTLTMFGDDETIAQLANDEEVARNVQEEWEGEEEKKMLAEEEATKVALTNEYDFKQVRINVDKILAEELQREEREKFTIKQRAKFLHDTIAAQKKFLAQQRLKKRVVNEEDTTKVPAKQEATEQSTKKRKSGYAKMIARKRPRPQPDDDSDDEHIKCLRITTFESTIDSEIMETKSFISRLHKVSSPDGNYLVVYKVNRHFKAFNYIMEVLHIFDRQDLFHLYDLVMKQYLKITPEDIELILWGDLKIMVESSTEENDQELKDGTIIYMLVERRYPLSKELLQQIIDLGLEVEEESTATLQLVRFIKQ
ncbi:hypothetical protein Tco_0183875 [Tanacetum coccineum]